MRTARQLRQYIRRLQAAGYLLRSEAMLRNTPHADEAIRIFDQLIADAVKQDAVPAAPSQEPGS